jgi:hypothetical protein
LLPAVTEPVARQFTHCLICYRRQSTRGLSTPGTGDRHIGVAGSHGPGVLADSTTDAMAIGLAGNRPDGATKMARPRCRPQATDPPCFNVALDCTFRLAAEDQTGILAGDGPISEFCQPVVSVACTRQSAMIPSSGRPVR